MPRELSENDVFNMTCDKLRKELKKKRLSSVGKKSELQFRLVEFLQTQKSNENEETIEEEEEKQEEVQDEPMETEDSDEPANATFTVDDGSDEIANNSLHEGTPTNAVSLVLDEDAKREMCADLGIDLHNFEVKSRVRVHRASARKSLRDSVVNERSSQKSPQPNESNENREETPIRQRNISRGVDRFAMIHAKEMEKEETLGERRDRMQKRHNELTGDVPEAIKRLATPKSVNKRAPINRSATRSSTRTWQPQNPAQMTFKFGNNDVNAFAEVASSKPDTGESSSSNVVKKTASRARAHVDVKQITRIPGPNRRAVTTPRIKKASRPEDSTFVDYMSTPKGTTPTRAPNRGGYTPFAGKKVFVDTTGLTDREYNLACEEGLIPGKRATKTALELRQMESKKRRDDIIALKRKLNVN